MAQPIPLPVAFGEMTHEKKGTVMPQLYKSVDRALEAAARGVA